MVGSLGSDLYASQDIVRATHEVVLLLESGGFRNDHGASKVILVQNPAQ
jgi:hypothetical protein